MKTRIWLMVGVVLLTAAYAIRAQVSSSTVKVRWDANTELDLAGYRLYWSNNIGNAYVRDCGLVNTQSVVLSGGTPWTFFVTAYNTAGMESRPSSNLVFTWPASPAAFRVIVGTVTVATNWVLVP